MSMDQIGRKQKPNEQNRVKPWPKDGERGIWPGAVAEQGDGLVHIHPEALGELALGLLAGARTSARPW